MSKRNVSFASPAWDAVTEDSGSTDDGSSGADSSAGEGESDSSCSVNFGHGPFHRLATPPVFTAPGLSLIDSDSDTDDSATPMTPPMDREDSDEPTCGSEVVRWTSPDSAHRGVYLDRSQMLPQGGVDEDEDADLSAAAVLRLRRMTRNSGFKAGLPCRQFVIMPERVSPLGVEEIVHEDQDDAELSEAAALALRRYARMR
eukprot:CAMPEP_0117468010 /NCGR_PEP_ID=MMETSP0784-20121206/5954_1 /TAXON_ID=39447 /ORGANISM="" /LENGTH=200 /DNA_ID=CAMNT_0005262003 /DNA_START=35 /DNA_END=637 /DNA_ORIENTATION=+